MQALAARDAGFAVDLLQHVMSAFEEVVDRMDGLLYQDALRRVARILDQHADIIFGEEAVVTRAYLPALVGTSREMTGRVLRRLESEGVVQRVGRDRLRLLDASGLARTAAGPSSARRLALGTSSSSGFGARCKSDVPFRRGGAQRPTEDHDCRVQDTSEKSRSPSLADARHRPHRPGRS